MGDEMMMRRLTNANWWIASLALGLIVAVTLPGVAGERKRSAKKAEREQVEPEVVGFYSAVEQGKLDVRVVPSNYSSLTMRVRNMTRTPLKIELPSVFAAVPVARVQAKQTLQMRGVQASLGSNFGQNYGNSQGLGGSLGGPWWGGGSLAQGRAQQGNQKQDGDKHDAGEQQHDDAQYLLLAPGRFAQTQIPCFCLEYGKPDPNKRIPYVLCRLEDLNNKPAVAELLERFVKQGINQDVAQLAAWHIANGVSWQVLSKVKFPRTQNSRAHRVTLMELAAAKKLAESMPSYGKQASLAGGR